MTTTDTIRMACRAWLVLLLCVTGTPVWPFAYHPYQNVRVVFQCDVPAMVLQCTVSGLQPVGTANQPVTVALPTDPQATADFLLRRSGYAETTLHCRVADLLKGRVPSEGCITMVPLTPWVPVVDFLSMHRVALLASAGGLMIIVLFVGMPFRRRLREQVRLLRMLEQDATSDPNVGKRLGPYRLIGRIGAGASATVYVALRQDDLEANRGSINRVAIKILHGSDSTHELSDRFVREVGICKSLNHPNLVRLLDWEVGVINYLVMELVDGVSLRQLIPATGMDPRQALELLRGIFAGLACAHAAGVVHCDLKPENVMITRSGQVRIMDFGIATGRDYRRLTHTSEVLGTLSYLSPEQLDGVRSDPRSDQYALGAIIFEMLSGRLPFVESDPLRLVGLHLLEPAPCLRDVLPTVSQAVSTVVERMLAKSPDHRYPTVDAAWSDLLAAWPNSSTDDVDHAG